MTTSTGCLLKACKLRVIRAMVQDKMKAVKHSKNFPFRPNGENSCWSGEQCPSDFLNKRGYRDTTKKMMKGKLSVAVKI